VLSASEDVPVVPDPRFSTGLVGRLDEHEVEPEREVRERLAVREAAPVEQPERGVPHPSSLPPVERLLRQPEVTPRAPADLDRDEGGGRAGVDRHDVQLVAADVEVPGEDRPAACLEAGRDESFGGVTRMLGLGPRAHRDARERWIIRP
jgi:hypothetical protein